MDYITKKYLSFYEKHGYFPKFFVPYNCREIVNIAPTITTGGAGFTHAGTVLIIVNKRKETLYGEKRN